MLTVNQLIDNRLKEWRKELIEYTFSSEDVERILKIPLASILHDNEMAWSDESSSVFSIRSTNKLLQSNLSTPSLLNLQAISKAFYRKLWSLNVPPKIKVSIWHISKGFIPTRVNLLLLRLAVDTMCPVCGNGTKDLTHVFRDYPITRDIWSLFGLQFLAVNKNTNWFEWLTRVFNSVSNGQAQIFCCALWTLWFERNKWLHEKVKRPCNELALFVINYLKEVDDLDEKTHTLLRIEGRWVPPLEGVVKLNFEAAFDVKNSYSGSEVVIRDEKATVLATFGVTHADVGFAFAAESLTCLEAIRMGVRKGFSRIMVEGDSLTVIKKCIQENPDLSIISAYIQSIKSPEPSFQFISFQHVNRESNGVVDLLAKKFLRTEEVFTWRDLLLDVL